MRGPWAGILLTAVASACAHDVALDNAWSVPDDEGGAETSLATNDPTIDEDGAVIFDPTGDGDAAVADPLNGADTALDDGGDASTEAAVPADAGQDAGCAEPPAPGDLVIDELMISSLSGTGDYGEWIEVRSTRDCALDLAGLHGECPNGAKVNSFDIVDDRWISPRGTFVIADSSNPAIDHSLPGMLIVWLGSHGDVLRNKGGTITLMMDAAILDSVTYPALKLVIGASIAFPSDCPLTARSDWTQWQTSTSSWFPGFLGTPNAPNTDVHCRPPP